MPNDQLHSAYAFKGSCFSSWKVVSCIWLVFPWLHDKKRLLKDLDCLVNIHVHYQSLTGIYQSDFYNIIQNPTSETLANPQICTKSCYCVKIKQLEWNCDQTFGSDIYYLCDGCKD